MLSAKLSEKSQNNVAFATTLKPSEEGRIEGREEGREEGTQQKALETARNALAMNLTAEQVAQITGLPLEQVQDLMAKVTAPA